MPSPVNNEVLLLSLIVNMVMVLPILVRLGPVGSQPVENV